MVWLPLNSRNQLIYLLLFIFSLVCQVDVSCIVCGYDQSSKSYNTLRCLDCECSSAVTHETVSAMG